MSVLTGGCSLIGLGGAELPEPDWSSWSPATENAMAMTVLVESDEDDTRPGVGPGSRLVFESDRAGNSDIWLYELADGGGVQQLTTSSEPDIEPSLHPNGENFFFLSNRTGEGAHYFMGTVGRPTAQVIVRAANPDLGTWTPGFANEDGTHFLYSSGSYVWVIDLETGSRTQLFEGYGPSWTPDGRILFRRMARDFGGFVSTSIWIADRDGTGSTELIPGGDNITVRDARMSPDGRRICYSVLEVVDGPEGIFGRPDIWVARADGSGQTQVTTAPGRDDECYWIDDERIAFASDRPPSGQAREGTAWNIWRATLPSEIH